MERTNWAPLKWVGALALAFIGFAALLEWQLPAPQAAPDPHTAVPSSGPAAAAAPSWAPPREPTDKGAATATAQGTVVDQQSGLPVAGATVNGGAGEVTTGSNGRFQVPLGPNAAAVAVRAPGYLPARVPPPPDQQPVTIRLDRTSLLRILVMHNGHPVSGARVSVLPPNPPKSATTNAQGLVSLGGLPADNYVITAVGPDGRTAGSAEAAVADRMHVEVLVALQAAAAVAGAVVEADGSAAGGARVWVETVDGQWLGAAVADAQGLYAVTPVAPADNARVHAVKAGRHGRTDAGNLGPGATKGDLTVILPAAQAEVGGMVVDPAGSPLAGAEVTLSPATQAGQVVWVSQRTDDNGAFLFSGLPAGRFDVAATWGEERVVRQGVASGERNLRLRMMGDTRITGRVVDEGSTPVGQFTVVAHFVEGGRWRNDGRPADGRDASGAANGPDGRFSVGPVDSGSYEITVRTADGRIGRSRAQVHGPGVVDVGDMVVRGAGTVVGVATDRRSGAAITGVEVSGGGQATVTGMSGRFELRLPPGRHSLWLSHPGYFGKRVDVPDLSADAEVDLGAVALVPGARKEIQGRNGFGGVGARLKDNKGQTLVEGLVEDGPAQRAGLQEGDIILSVDGETLVGGSVWDAVSIIRGEAGSTVWLTVSRGGQEVDVAVRREAIRMENQ